MTEFEHDDDAWGWLVGRCQLLAGRAADGFPSALLPEVRQLVEEMPDFHQPVPQILVRTTIAGVLLRCFRQCPSDLPADLTSALLEFATRRSSTESLRRDCLMLIGWCDETISGMRRPPSDQESVHRVLGVIRARYTDANLTLCQIAREARLSVSHVSRLLNQHTGCGVRAHLHQLRVSDARRLLDGSTRTIKEIAVGVGYRSTSQLDRHFRQLCNMTPAEFRRNARVGEAKPILRAG